MELIAIVIRELTFLKVLQPIMDELSHHGKSYNIYHFDAPRGNKEYNRATLGGIKNVSPKSTKNAKKVKAFANDKQLLSQLIGDKITKLVSIEIWLWAKSYIGSLKKNNIKTYSLMYLTDSIWQSDPACITSIDRVYYASPHTMRAHHDFAGVVFNAKRDQCLGSPIFEKIMNKPSAGKDILVLLPNLRKEHVPVSFGNAGNFIKIIEKLSEGRDLIFKTRKKQWLPKEIEKYAKEIVYDGNEMFPPVTVDLFKRCYTTVMFYSSGIYEAVYGGQYVLNIPLPLKSWRWDSENMKKYFSTEDWNLYQFNGVVDSVSQKAILQDDWKFEPKSINSIHRRWWVEKFIQFGPGSKSIVLDIIRS